MKKISQFILIVLLLLGDGFAQSKPHISGGLQAFAQRKLVYPLYAKDNCIQGTIELVFKLNLKGQITYLSVSKGLGADLDAEAKRLVQLSSGRWQVPAGYDTTALIHAPIHFSLQDYGCDTKYNANQAWALSRYREQQKIVAVITNYYRETGLGRKLSITQSEIEGLKNQLGIDDDYISRKIAVAEKKLKLGDKKGACDDFMEIKNLGFAKGAELLNKYCK